MTRVLARVYFHGGGKVFYQNDNQNEWTFFCPDHNCYLSDAIEPDDTGEVVLWWASRHDTSCCHYLEEEHGIFVHLVMCLQCTVALEMSPRAMLHCLMLDSMHSLKLAVRQMSRVKVVNPECVGSEFVGPFFHRIGHGMLSFHCLHLLALPVCNHLQSVCNDWVQYLSSRSSGCSRGLIPGQTAYLRVRNNLHFGDASQLEDDVIHDELYLCDHNILHHVA